MANSNAADLDDQVTGCFFVVVFMLLTAGVLSFTIITYTLRLI